MSQVQARSANETPSLARGMLLFAPISLLANSLGPVLRYPEAGSAVLFLPYAVLTTALLTAPRRHWLWYLGVGSLAHFVTHWPMWALDWVLLADVANVARALTAVVLLLWLFAGPPRLDGIRELVLFVVSAVCVAPAVGATIGAANVVLHGVSPNYWQPWRAWFMSNALTGLTALPALILVVGHAGEWRARGVDVRRVLEGALLAVALGVSCALAFLLPSTGTWQPTLQFYAPFPVLMWAALRFGPAGTSLALAAVTFSAIAGTARSTGPFRAASSDENILALQLFLLLTTIPALTLAAVASARRRAVRLYRALLASLQDHVAILDARGLVLEVNESWRRFAESAPSDRFHSVLAGDDYLHVCRLAASAGDATAEQVLVGVTKVLSRESRRFELEYDRDAPDQRTAYTMSVEALERPDGGVVVTRADVTASHQARIEIEEQRRELSHLARVAVLGQLSGALAHELKQPLAAISSNAEAASRLLQRQPADLQEVGAILDDILTDDQRAVQVIHRLSAMLRRGETNLQPMDTRELVTDVLELAHSELLTRRVSVTADVEPDLPPVLGDRVQIQQVLLNLILNACEAMSHTPAPERRLFLQVASEGRGLIRFSIRDHGHGIPDHLMDRLFEPFVTTKPEGLGLGLSISRAIVAAHGGRLWAQNNADQGATMHCLLASALSAAPLFDPSPTMPRSVRLSPPTMS